VTIGVIYGSDGWLERNTAFGKLIMARRKVRRSTRNASVCFRPRLLVPGLDCATVLFAATDFIVLAEITARNAPTVVVREGIQCAPVHAKSDGMAVGIWAKRVARGTAHPPGKAVQQAHTTLEITLFVERAWAPDETGQRGLTLTPTFTFTLGARACISGLGARVEWNGRTSIGARFVRFPSAPETEQKHRHDEKRHSPSSFNVTVRRKKSAACEAGCAN
jgi:hypothetical protein